MFIFLLSANLYGQDPILGIYNCWRMQVEFKSEGTFTMLDSHFEKYPFYGKWERINDSTVLAKFDTLINLMFYDSIFIDKMYFSLLMWHEEVLEINILFSDKTQDRYLYMRSACFYPDNKINSETAYTTNKNSLKVITNYFPNRVTHEVICYENGLKEGIYLKYYQNGQLELYQKWHKGKLKKEERFVCTDKSDIISYQDGKLKNDTTYSESGNYFITTYYQNRSIHEITCYKKGIKDGVYFEYNTDSRLDLHQIWRKGKLKGKSRFWGSNSYY